MPPDQWQRRLLLSNHDRNLVLCSRQAGKTESTASKALGMALYKPDALVLIISPSERQSGELFRRIVRLFNRLGKPIKVVEKTKFSMQFANGSRIIALPDSEETIRGYSSVDLMLLDEAALIPDDLYRAVRPMLAVSRGQLVAMTTPRGKRGWFYEEWISQRRWDRYRVTADQVPRLSADFLAEEREAMGQSMYDQEYGCSFEGSVGRLVPVLLMQRCEELDCLWPGGKPPGRTDRLYVGIDVGRSAKATAGRTVVWTWEKRRGVLVCREIFVMHGREFSEQEKEISDRIARPNVVRAHIDKGGIGNQLAEDLEKKFGNRVVGIQLTDRKQGELGMLMRAAFEKGEVEIPCDQVLRDDFQLVSEAVDAQGLPVIRTDTNQTGHADRFWAAALALDASRNWTAPPSFGRPVGFSAKG